MTTSIPIKITVTQLKRDWIRCSRSYLGVCLIKFIITGLVKWKTKSRLDLCLLQLDTIMSTVQCRTFSLSLSLSLSLSRRSSPMGIGIFTEYWLNWTEFGQTSYWVVLPHATIIKIRIHIVLVPDTKLYYNTISLRVLGF
jgi:hypothetical protein